MSRPGRLSLFVLIDALGWKVLDAHPFLADLLPHRRPVKTVLGYSSGAIPTILTGLAPAEHGHWNLLYYDPDGSPFRWLRRATFLPESALDNRLSRRALKEIGRRVHGLGPLFECCVRPRLLPWFNWVEKRSIYEPGGIGGAASIFDDLQDRGIRWRAYTYHRWTDEQILMRAGRDVAAGAAEVYFLYLSEIDALLHRHCEDRPRVGARLGWYSAALRGLFELALRRDPEASLAIFSDHGMTPVKAHHDLVGEVERLGFRTPEQYLAVYDSTMARFWFFDDRARRAISERLSGLRYARVLGEAELRELGVLFPDRRYGELIALAEPGALIAGSGFNGTRWRPAGMHGYHPDHAWSDGVFLGNEPPARPVRTLADVHACLRQALEPRRAVVEALPA